MKGFPIFFKLAAMVGCIALLVSCPVNVQPPMKVIEPMDTTEIQWQVENKIDLAGFIRNPAVEPSGEIVSTRKKRYELFKGNQVIVREAPEAELVIGGKYLTYRLLSPPVIDDRYPVKGYHHLITGMIEIVDDWKGLFEGQVIASYRGVSTTDLIKPVDELDPISIHQAPPGITGRILASEERTLSFTTNDLVLLDRGSHSGVQRGQMFSIYDQETVARKGQYTKDDLYLRVGMLIVLRTEQETATALILNSDKELYPGIFFMSGFEDTASLGSPP